MASRSVLQPRESIDGAEHGSSGRGRAEIGAEIGTRSGRIVRTGIATRHRPGSGARGGYKKASERGGFGRRTDGLVQITNPKEIHYIIDIIPTIGGTIG